MTDRKCQCVPWNSLVVVLTSWVWKFRMSCCLIEFYKDFLRVARGDSYQLKQPDSWVQSIKVSSYWRNCIHMVDSKIHSPPSFQRTKIQMKVLLARFFPMIRTKPKSLWDQLNVSIVLKFSLVILVNHKVYGMSVSLSFSFSPVTFVWLRIVEQANCVSESGYFASAPPPARLLLRLKNNGRKAASLWLRL